MRVVVTGASGFIGKAVASNLVERGHQVTSVEHKKEVALKGARTVRADVTERSEVDHAFEHAEVVIHCAARMKSLGGEDSIRRTNVLGTKNVFESSVENRVRQVVYLSSTCVLNEYVDHEMTDENHPYPDRPLDRYTQSKIEAERIAKTFQDKLNVIIFRPGWVWGPESNEMARLCKALESGLFAVPGSGSNALHLVYIDNLVHAIDLAILNSAQGTYILTDGQDISLGEFVQHISDGLGAIHNYLHLPYRLCYRAAWLSEHIGMLTNLNLPTRLEVANLGKSHRFNTERIRTSLGYSPPVTFKDGVRETVSWYKRSRE